MIRSQSLKSTAKYHDLVNVVKRTGEWCLAVSDLAHDGNLLRCAKKVELPVEEINSTVQFRDDKCVRGRLSG